MSRKKGREELARILQFRRKIEEKLIPEIQRLGFENVPLTEEDRKIEGWPKHFPFGRFYRPANGDKIEVIELQLEQNSRQRVRLNFWVGPKDNPTQEGIGILTTLDVAQSPPDRFPPMGYGVSWWRKRLYGYEAAVDQCMDKIIANLPEIMDWFATGKVTKNIRILPFPKQAKPELTDR